ncbi:NAD(P)-dependent oxidoreductase [bacterium]|nr:NAD(P)-dependent oxidoreductase [bacterium]
METEDQLEAILSSPTPEVGADLAKLDGDIMILGVGGKIGPSLGQMAARAAQEAGLKKKVHGVDYVFSKENRARLTKAGVVLHECNLLDRQAVAKLPAAANIVFMAGKKFGSTGAECDTWAMNVYLSGIVADRFRDARISVFSSGNIYGLVPLGSGGATETDPLNPIGDYAQSVVGRERMFEYASRHYGTRIVQFRLCYAIDLRYGVLRDVAEKVQAGQPVDVSMGHYNCIWQGDVNTIALRSLTLADSPPRILNVTGPETVSVRYVANRFGELLGKKPIVTGEEAPTAILNNCAAAFASFGYPRVPLDLMMRWIAHWLQVGGASLGKPTHYETRDGKF